MDKVTEREEKVEAEFKQRAEQTYGQTQDFTQDYIKARDFAGLHKTDLYINI